MSTSFVQYSCFHNADTSRALLALRGASSRDLASDGSRDSLHDSNFFNFNASFKSCACYMSSWTKEANDTESKMTFIQGKKKAEDRLWKLIIVAEEPEDITALDDEMYKELSAQVRKTDALAVKKRRNK